MDAHKTTSSSSSSSNDQITPPFPSTTPEYHDEKADPANYVFEKMNVVEQAEYETSSTEETKPTFYSRFRKYIQ